MLMHAHMATTCRLCSVLSSHGICYFYTARARGCARLYERGVSTVLSLHLCAVDERVAVHNATPGWGVRAPRYEHTSILARAKRSTDTVGRT